MRRRWTAATASPSTRRAASRRTRRGAAISRCRAAAPPGWSSTDRFERAAMESRTAGARAGLEDTGTAGDCGTAMGFFRYRTDGELGDMTKHVFTIGGGTPNRTRLCLLIAMALASGGAWAQSTT